MIFGMIMLKENMIEKENLVIWIQTASLFMYKQMIFTKTIQKIFDTANYELGRPLAKEKNYWINQR